MGNCKSSKKNVNNASHKFENVSDLNTIISNLNTIPDSAKKFSLNGFVSDARVLRIINGDTLEVIFRFRGSYDTWTCRMADINAPETRGGTEESKKRGLESKIFLENAILKKVVKIHCKGFDQYGRLLILIDNDGEDIGEKMILNGHAVRYVPK